MSGGRLAVRGFLLSVATALAFSGAYLAFYRENGLEEMASEIIHMRLGCAEVAQLGWTATYYSEGGVAHSVSVIRVGDVMVSNDGEELVFDPEDLRLSGVHLSDIDSELLDFWRSHHAYISVSPGLKNMYRSLLCGGDCEQSAFPWREFCVTEYNRVIRDMVCLRNSWGHIARRALLVVEVARRLGAQEVIDAARSIVDTANWARDIDRTASLGNVELVDWLCRIEIDGSDGEVFRTTFNAVRGRYSGDWLFGDTPRRKLVGLSKYWDSRLVTRYVIRLDEGLWRMVTLGERVRAIAASLVGRECSAREFEAVLLTAR